MSRKPRGNPLFVLIDMDQVLCKFEERVLETYRKRYPDEPFVPLEERQGFWIHEQYTQFAGEEAEVFFLSYTRSGPGGCSGGWGGGCGGGGGVGGVCVCVCGRGGTPKNFWWVCAAPVFGRILPPRTPDIIAHWQVAPPARPPSRWLPHMILTEPCCSFWYSSLVTCYNY